MLKNTAEGDTAVFFVCHKTTHPPARAALPFRLGDAFCARRVLLLVFVDLDIAGRVFILNKQQGGGQGMPLRGERLQGRGVQASLSVRRRRMDGRCRRGHAR